jgi:large repetitive protein
MSLSDCDLVYAGIDQALCGGNAATLTGTGLSTGTWTAQSGNPTGASLSTSVAGVATATFTTTANGNFNFIYTADGCTDTLKVTATAKPRAGTDQTVCAGTKATLKGTVPTTGTWTAKADNPTAVTLSTSVAGVATATFGTVDAGIYNFIYTAGSCSDTVKVTVTAKPNAGIDQGICSGTKTILKGTIPSTGIWTAENNNPGGASLSTSVAGVATATFTAAAIGTFNFIYTANGCTDTVKVITTAKPFAGKDQAPICVGVLPTTTATLAATAISGGVWTQKASNPLGATITAPSAANSDITGLNPGYYEFVWTVATCSDTVKITIPSCNEPCSKAVIYSKVQTICEGGTPKAFTALPSSGVNYAWYGPLADTTSTLGTAIASATLATYAPTGSFAIGTKYYAVITTSGTCLDTAFAALTVIAKPAAIKLCANESYTITAEAGATAIQWYKNGVAVTDSTKSTFVVKSIGTYTYSAIKANSDMCRDTLCCPHIFEACALGVGSIGDYVFLDKDNIPFRVID